jgi:enoyl-CoA hydratase/carnithine racemase
MTSVTNHVIVEKDGAIGRLMFNNPERRNAISYEMWQAISITIADFAADDAVRVIVLSGAGGKAFAAGADISQFADKRGTEDAVADYNATVKKACRDLTLVAKPTIARIEGYCIGGGISVAQCCDLRLASNDARFGIPAARLGLGYQIDGLTPLVDLVGPSFAKEILFTARQFDAEEARAMGLVNRVLPKAVLGVLAVKMVVGEILMDPDERDLDLCQKVVDDCYASDDYKEGWQAFMEKRKPEFKGR